jgi:hypothetical protein
MDDETDTQEEINHSATRADSLELTESELRARRRAAVRYTTNQFMATQPIRPQLQEGTHAPPTRPPPFDPMAKWTEVTGRGIAPAHTLTPEEQAETERLGRQQAEQARARREAEHKASEASETLEARVERLERRMSALGGR